MVKAGGSSKRVADAETSQETIAPAIAGMLPSMNGWTPIGVPVANLSIDTSCRLLCSTGLIVLKSRVITSSPTPNSARKTYRSASSRA
jgi:hypothetical protein